MVKMQNPDTRSLKSHMKDSFLFITSNFNSCCVSDTSGMDLIKTSRNLAQCRGHQVIVKT